MLFFVCSNCESTATLEKHATHRFPRCFLCSTTGERWVPSYWPCVCLEREGCLTLATHDSSLREESHINSSSAVVKNTVAWQLAKGRTSLKMMRGTMSCPSYLFLPFTHFFILIDLFPLQLCFQSLPTLPSISHTLCNHLFFSVSVCFPHFV